MSYQGSMTFKEALKGILHSNALPLAIHAEHRWQQWINWNILTDRNASLTCLHLCGNCHSSTFSFPLDWDAACAQGSRPLGPAVHSQPLKTRPQAATCPGTTQVQGLRPTTKSFAVFRLYSHFHKTESSSILNALQTHISTFKNTVHFKEIIP